jgi:hypothetical protein
MFQFFCLIKHIDDFLYLESGSNSSEESIDLFGEGDEQREFELSLDEVNV